MNKAERMERVAQRVRTLQDSPRYEYRKEKGYQISRQFSWMMSRFCTHSWKVSPRSNPPPTLRTQFIPAPNPNRPHSARFCPILVGITDRKPPVKSIKEI